MRRALLLTFVAVPVLVAVACSDDPAPAGGGGSPDASTSRDGASESSTPADSGADAAPADVCAVERQHATDCKTALECGAGFDAWCKDLDAKTNSEARRAGERQCLTPDNCDKDKAKDCIYRSYAKAQRSAAQDALLTAYCQTCFASPGDVALCKAAAPAYDPAKGPGSVTDVFLAVWELSDALASSIKDKCTGAALDGGAPADGGDGGVDCARAFAVCAGGLYVDALPNCP